MPLHLRPETPADHRPVEELTRRAFWNLYSPGCQEHYLAHILRTHPDFLPAYDFVAELDGNMVGSIMYTRSWLLDEQGQSMDILTFGPVCVLPEVQRQGIGSALIRHTAQLAAQQGEKAIVIFGDPQNYCKHGFKNGKDLNISDQNGDYPYAMLALELLPGALNGHAWKYHYSSVYHLDEAAVEAFDQGFEPLEKGHRYTQDIFSINIRAYIR
jgi:putative acetyltransferase